MPPPISETVLEQQFIGRLEDLKYAFRLDIRDRASLQANFREKFESLNQCKLTNKEFDRLLQQIVRPDVFLASRSLRERDTFEREDGTPLHFELVNTRDWCKNSFEVINQLRMNTANSFHRYDVVLLLNGIPVVQVELKQLSVNPRKALEQIVAYKADAGNGYANSLLCFLQIFVVSNQTETYYFANNNDRHFTFNAEERFLPVYKWAKEDNTKVTHLDDFAQQFLAKCLLGEMISRYMVLVQTEQKILMMRPYQIYAVRNIVRCIDQNCGNGYVWHTTGSGKTLTSFKASTLLKDNPLIEKVLFVVDRKDLDTQTRDEFNRFQPDCVEENISTKALVERMLSDDYADKVIVTTIQKLGNALDNANGVKFADRLKKLSDKRVVFVFDECHRSQFGETHKAIKQFFPRAQMFGFTGTPIFEDNSTAEERIGDQKYKLTTRHLFPHELHRYTISNAIDDRNVLGFQVEYYKPDGKHAVTAGETLKKQKVVEEILSKHSKATLDRRFNALLATNSIPDAIEYVQCFQEIQEKKAAADPTFVPLNVACIFSPPPSPAKDTKFAGEDLAEDLPQEQEDNKQDPDKKRDALTNIITDYNTRFGTNHRLDDFYAYYRDVQKRIKNQKLSSADLPRAQKIDVCIVVDMLLTGFDSQYLKVLYVDKRLKHHGLIQAFSRTNRTLNDTKPWGTIVDFRGQEEQVDDAMKLFSGEDLDRARKIWLVDASPVVLGKLKQAVAALTSFMQAQGLKARPEDVANLKGDNARAGFVERFASVQAFSNQLDQYTDLTPQQEAEREQVMAAGDIQGFRVQYLETVRKLREHTPDDGSPGPADTLDFNLVLFSSASIDYDYIMALVAKGGKPEQIKASREQAKQLMAADSKFDDPQEIGAYIDSLELRKYDENELRTGFEQFKAAQKLGDLERLSSQHQLPAKAVQSFVEEILDRRIFDGERLTDLFAAQELPWKERARREHLLMTELKPLLLKWSTGREIAGLRAYE